MEARQPLLPASSFTELDKSLTWSETIAILTTPGREGKGQAAPRGVAWLFTSIARFRTHDPREEERP